MLENKTMNRDQIFLRGTRGPSCGADEDWCHHHRRGDETVSRPSQNSLSVWLFGGPRLDGDAGAKTDSVNEMQSGILTQEMEGNGARWRPLAAYSQT